MSASDRPPHPFGDYGNVCGPASELIALDIDTDDPEIRARINNIVPPSDVRKIGQKGETPFYRYNGHASKKLKLHSKAPPVVELLSIGCQTVLPPSIHPVTNEPYYFPTPNSLHDVKVTDLPELPLDIMDQLARALKDFKIDPKTLGTGGRNDALKSQVWAAIIKGKVDEEIANEILKFDQAHHRPPLFSDPLEYSKEKRFWRTIHLCTLVEGDPGMAMALPLRKNMGWNMVPLIVV